MPFRLTTLVTVLALTVLAACDSPEERAEEHYQQGLALIAEGDFDRAIVELRNVFRLAPNHREARMTLAEVMLNERDNVRAAYGQYLRIAEQYPDDLEVRAILGELAFSIQNWEELERHVDQAELLAPEDPKVQTLIAARDYRVAALAGDEPTLRELGRRVAALKQEQPDSEILHSLAMDAHVRAGDLRSAIAELDWLLERRPNDQRFWRQRMNILVQLEDYDALEEQLQTMVTRFPDEVSHKSTLVQYYMSRQQPDKAEAFLRDLVAGAEDGNISPRVDLIRFLTEIRGPEAGRAEVDAAMADTPDEPRFRVLAASMDYDAGQRDEAIAALESTIEGAEPSELTRDIKVALARMLVGTGNEVGARARIEEVLEEDPEQVSALKMQAGWLIEADDTDAAISALRIALDKSGEDSDAMTLMAQAYTRTGQPELARDFLALAVSASNNAPAETVRYARVLMNEESYLPAEDILLPALRLNPQNFDLLVTIGQLYLAMEDLGRAEQVVTALRGLDEPRAREAANALEAERINRSSGPDDAITFLEGLAAASDDGDVSLTSKLALVRARLRTGDTEGALTQARLLLEENPESEALQTMLAAVASAAGELDEAETMYRALLDSNPERPEIWRELATVKVRQGASDAAYDIVNRGLEAAPEDANLLWAKASFLERRGDIEGAIEIYEGLYERNSNSMILANNLASLISTYRTDPESLEQAWTIARRLTDTEVPALQDTYGWIAHRRGDSQTALPYLESAARGLPRDPLVQYHLGVVYETLAQPEKALEQYQRAVELAGPADQRAQIADARARMGALLNPEPAAETTSETTPEAAEN